jgi:hypothetical protein
MSAPMGRVKSAIYARMEETSFRSGVGLAAGVLVAAGLAIALPVTLDGHSVAATGASRPSAVARLTPPPFTAAPAAPSASQPAVRPAASLAPVGASRSPGPQSPSPGPADLAQSFPYSDPFMANGPEYRHGGRPDRDWGGPPGGWPGWSRHGPHQGGWPSHGHR